MQTHLQSSRNNADESPQLKMQAGATATRAKTRVLPAGVGNAPLAVLQWHLDAPPSEPAGTALHAALDTVRQLSRVVVAVVDTGILSDHLDTGTLLPGYDFVSDLAAANDGDGRDNDPTDPGDWVTQAEIDEGIFSEECTVSNSSWHGTAVAGMLAPNHDNAIGIDAAAPIVDILAVRVMGRCGGTVSDLISGIRWAAGLEVEGVRTNDNPASVINLSLVYAGHCAPPMQQAINDAREAGAVIVVAVGNGGNSLNQQPHSPASCNGVIVVAGSNRAGNFASYNNSGNVVDILAPGGDPGIGLITLDDGGSQQARHDSLYTYRYGSSIAAPLVSATAALIIAANPLLLPDQVETLINDNARAVSDATLCPEGSCGAGLLDARLAVHAAAFSDVRSLTAKDVVIVTGGSGSLNAQLLLLLALALLYRGYLESRYSVAVKAR